MAGSQIARLWYCDDMDAIRGWLAHWEFCMTTCAIPKFALRYTEVIRWTRGGQDLPTCIHSNLTMIYAEVMLEKHVNWSTMTAHSRSHIIIETLTYPQMLIGTRGSCNMPQQTGYSGKDGLHQQKPHEACKYIQVWKTKDGIIISQATVINIGARNHGIRKAQKGVISIEHGMITTRTKWLNTRTWNAHGEVGKVPIVRTICMEGC